MSAPFWSLRELLKAPANRVVVENPPTLYDFPKGS